jgi:hypothetical protein
VREVGSSLGGATRRDEPPPHPSAGRPRGSRTRGAWLLVIPFFLFADPTPGRLVLGAFLAAIGLLVRGWAAGTIRKDEALTTTGPYAHTRHPLYFGSFLIAIGLALAGGHWLWPMMVVAYFMLVYRPTVREEAERLTELFGHRYVHYAAKVPAIVPRLRPYAASADAHSLAWPSGRAGEAPGAAATDDVLDHDGSSGAFTWQRYLRNREWEALAGALAAFVLVAIKMRFGR